MSNNQLPAEVQERINADAVSAYPLTNGNDLETGKRIGYLAGATAEVERAQRAIDLLQELVNLKERKDKEGKFIGYERLKQIAWERAKDFLQQWKEGKEAGDDK